MQGVCTCSWRHDAPSASKTDVNTARFTWRQEPTMAPKLERFVSPGKGNGLRATARIKRGELVYSCEPLACCVSNKLSRDVCHHCFTRWDRRQSSQPLGVLLWKGSCSVVEFLCNGRLQLCFLSPQRRLIFLVSAHNQLVCVRYTLYTWYSLQLMVYWWLCVFACSQEVYSSWLLAPYIYISTRS